MTVGGSETHSERAVGPVLGRHCSRKSSVVAPTTLVGTDSMLAETGPQSWHAGHPSRFIPPLGLRLGARAPLSCSSLPCPTASSARVVTPTTTNSALS